MVELELSPAGFQRVGKLHVREGVIEDIQATLQDFQAALQSIQTAISNLQGSLNSLTNLVGTITPVGENDTVGEILSNHEARISALESP